LHCHYLQRPKERCPSKIDRNLICSRNQAARRSSPHQNTPAIFPEFGLSRPVADNSR
jgi:hypothetical protein